MLLPTCVVLAISIVAADSGASDVTPADVHAPLFDRSRDAVVRRSVITSGPGRHGQTSVLTRGHALVVQTALHSRVLKRIVAVIHRKETDAWVEGREGWQDSRRYIDALEEARARVSRAYAARKDRGDRRQSLLIEFILSPSVSLVTLTETSVTVDTEDNGPGPPRYRIGPGAPTIVLDVSRVFVKGNMHNIARDQFSLTDDETSRFLEPLLQAMTAPGTIETTGTTTPREGQ